MKLARIRLKHLMLALAAVAVLIELSGVGPRWRGYYRSAFARDDQAKECLFAARRFEGQATQLREQAARLDDPARQRALLLEVADAEYQAAAFRELARWNGTIGRIHREALYRPWAPATPEPSFVSSAEPPR